MLSNIIEVIMLFIPIIGVPLSLYILAFTVFKPRLVPFCENNYKLCNGLCYNIIPNLVPCTDNFYISNCMNV